MEGLQVLDTQSYWDRRYSDGGNSGNGSCGYLLDFKAQYINSFIRLNNIDSIQDFGCGDGSLLSKLDIKDKVYCGYDVSNFLLESLRVKYDKQFLHFDEYDGSIISDLVLSIDVIFHLVDDEVYRRYIETIQKATRKFLIIYSSDTDDNGLFGSHIRHRKFSDDIRMKMIKKTPNRYPYLTYGEKGSFSDFYIFQTPELELTKILK